MMMENVRFMEALGRSRLLVRRSLATSVGAVIIMFLIPALAAGAISFVVNVSAKALDPKPPKAAVESVQSPSEQPLESGTPSPGGREEKRL